MNTMQTEELIATQDTSPKRKGGSVVNWSGFIIAFILLANPMPMLLDILPDFIAYLIILFALRRAVGEIDVFDDFKKTTSKLLALTAAKIVAFFVMVNIWGGDPRQKSIVAVFTLCFGIVEFLYLRSWVHDFYEAMARYGQRYNCHAALAETGHSYRLSPEKLELMTFIFFAVRSLLSCLPEVTLVPITGDALTKVFDWNAMYPACALVAAIVVLIFGIIWCCYVIAYILRISRDHEASARMRADITLGSRAERENDYRLIRFATYFFLGGILLQIDLILDHVNYLPDVLSALLFFAAGYTVFSLLGRHRAAFIVPLIYAGVSLAYTVFHSLFYASYTDTDLVARADGALAAYLPVVITSALSAVLLTVTCLLLFFALRDTVRCYTGITVGGLNARRIDEQLRHTPPAEETMLRGAYGVGAARTIRELNVKLIILTILGFLASLVITANDLLMLIAPPPMQGQGQDPDFFTVFIYGWTDTAVWIFVLVWFIFAYHVCARIRKEAEINLIEE